MQPSNKTFIEDFTKLTADIIYTLLDARKELDQMAHDNMYAMIGSVDQYTQEQFSALKEMSKRMDREVQQFRKTVESAAKDFNPENFFAFADMDAPFSPSASKRKAPSFKVNLQAASKKKSVAKKATRKQTAKAAKKSAEKKPAPLAKKSEAKKSARKKSAQRKAPAPKAKQPSLPSANAAPQKSSMAQQSQTSLSTKPISVPSQNVTTLKPISASPSSAASAPSNRPSSSASPASNVDGGPTKASN